MLDFATGPFNTKANDRGSPVLTVTLTEASRRVVLLLSRFINQSIDIFI
jgi:hypothetical protein